MNLLPSQAKQQQQQKRFISFGPVRPPPDGRQTPQVARAARFLCIFHLISWIFFFFSGGVDILHPHRSDKDCVKGIPPSLSIFPILFFLKSPSFLVVIMKMVFQTRHQLGLLFRAIIIFPTVRRVWMRTKKEKIHDGWKQGGDDPCGSDRLRYGASKCQRRGG